MRTPAPSQSDCTPSIAMLFSPIQSSSLLRTVHLEPEPTPRSVAPKYPWTNGCIPARGRSPSPSYAYGAHLPTETGSVYHSPRRRSRSRSPYVHVIRSPPSPSPERSCVTSLSVAPSEASTRAPYPIPPPSMSRFVYTPPPSMSTSSTKSARHSQYYFTVDLVTLNVSILVTPSSTRVDSDDSVGGRLFVQTAQDLPREGLDVFPEDVRNARCRQSEG